MRTLRLRELCRHERDSSTVNNQHRNLDAHIGSYIFYEDLYRSDRITTYVVPFVIGMLLSRDLIVGILPQAFKLVIPPLGNQFINLIKNSSVLAFVAGFDLMYQGDVIAL